MYRFAFVALLGLIASCTSQGEEKPSITGAVIEAAPVDGNKTIKGRFSIEGKGQYDKASVKVTDKTVIKLGDGKDAKDGKFEDIKKGSKLVVWFTGPVAESYPVQATAGKIVIVTEPEKK